MRSLEQAGAGAVVLFSLFAEQIQWDTHTYAMGAGSAPTARYLPDWKTEPIGPNEYLDLLSLAKRSLDIPVIGSLNGFGPGEWTRYARLIEGAGADALELNLYYLPTDALVRSASVEETYLQTVREVRKTITCPLAVKITPYFTSLPAMADQFVEAGADGLVLYNRFYQPDFDIETGSVHAPGLTLSASDDLRLPLRWIARLFGKVDADLALTGGVHDHIDAIKAIMAGASVAMMPSELLTRGPARLGEILSDLSGWLQSHHYESVSAIRGKLSMGTGIITPGSSERSGYINTIRSVNGDGTPAERAA